MAERLINPSRLEGDDLRRWYLRSPDEIERERRDIAEQRHTEFFGASLQTKYADQESKPRQVAADGDTLWIANGYGGFSPARPNSNGYFSPSGLRSTGDLPDYLPENAASPEGGELIEIGNPNNPRMIREWEHAYGRDWPRTADGRPHDVAHIRAIADGGTNTLENIRPMDPAEHRASHKGDAGRWGKRSSIARAFGGRVEPPMHAPRPRGGLGIKGLGLLGIIPTITGLLSGRIRTDTPMHTLYDVFGVPSQDDPPPGDLFT